MALALWLQKNRECIFLSHDLGPECNLLWALAKVVTSRNLSTLFGFLYFNHPEDCHHMTGYNWTQHKPSTQRLTSNMVWSHWVWKQFSREAAELATHSASCSVSSAHMHFILVCMLKSNPPFSKNPSPSLSTHHFLIPLLQSEPPEHQGWERCW